jgi:hypothetical protein
MAGDGALANIAIERARGASRTYSLARILETVLTSGVPPQQFRLDRATRDALFPNPPAAGQPPSS